MKRINMLPNGIKDYLYEESYNKDLIERKLSNLFSSSGYYRIVPPVLEYLDTYTFSEFARTEKIFKLADYDGSMLALRPDTTLQIARIAATKLPKTINRVFYNVNAFEYGFSNTQQERSREFSQCGIELMGMGGSKGDIEVITIAVEALQEIGITDFKIEIGHVGLFMGIMEYYGLDGNLIEQIKECVNNKDLVEVERLLSDANVSAEAKKNIMCLPSLFGGEKVFKNINHLALNQKCADAINNIKEVYNYFQNIGLGDYITIDFGLVQNLSYYTGIVFRGIAQGYGLPLLAGGRYDNLTKYFGADICAVGFAIGTKRVLEVLSQRGKLQKLPKINRVIAVSGADEKTAYQTIKQLRNQGESVVVVEKDDIVEFCKSQGIKFYSFITNDGVKDYEL